MLNGDLNNSRALGVGICAIQIYFPKKFVDQNDLEAFDKVSQGKYTIGLGQLKMACVDDREDINSMCLTAVKSLMESYNISYQDIGRLEVGTETIIDKSKSVKSVLMQLFQEHGNTDIEGVDTTNACYGGTNALFNTINWVESSSWDGRYGLVVAGDIAVYKSGSARPTGGAGVVAMLVGPNAPLTFDAGLRVSHMEHVWDFYKPDLHSEYPEVDGPLSNACYIRAVDTCYNRYLDRLAKKTMEQADLNSAADYFCFHTPYSKLIQKSFARLAFNDIRRNPQSSAPELAKFAEIPVEQTYVNKEIEKAFMDLTKDAFKTKVIPSLTCAKNLGNMYCGSLYGGLASVLSEISSEDLLGRRVVLFSYGSGLASSMFSLTVTGSTTEMARVLNLQKRLSSRKQIHPEEYDRVMLLREGTHNKKDYEPVSEVSADNLFPGTFYLNRVDEKFRRTYGRLEA